MYELDEQESRQAWEILIALDDEKRKVLVVIPNSVLPSRYIRTYIGSNTYTPVLIVTPTREGAVIVKQRFESEGQNFGLISEKVDYSSVNFISDIDTILSKPFFDKIKMLVFYQPDLLSLQKIKKLIKKYENRPMVAFSSSPFNYAGSLLPFGKIINNYRPQKWIERKKTVPCTLFQITLNENQRLGIRRSEKNKNLFDADIRRCMGKKHHRRMVNTYMDFYFKKIIKKVIVFTYNEDHGKKIEKIYKQNIYEKDVPVLLASKKNGKYYENIDLFKKSEKGVLIHPKMPPEGLLFDGVNAIQIEYPCNLRTDFLRLCDVIKTRKKEEKECFILDHGDNIVNFGSPDFDVKYSYKKKYDIRHETLIAVDIKSNEKFNLDEIYIHLTDPIREKTLLIYSEKNYINVLQNMFFTRVTENSKFEEKLTLYEQFINELIKLKIKPKEEDIRNWFYRCSFPNSWYWQQMNRLERFLTNNSKAIKKEYHNSFTFRYDSFKEYLINKKNDSILQFPNKTSYDFFS